MTSMLEPSSKKPKTDDTDGDAVSSSTHEMIKSDSKNLDLLREASEALQESNRRHVRPIVDEIELGIELFVGDKKDEFHGLIKTRYADFIVHEVDQDGNYAKLTNLDIPEDSEAASTLCLTDFIDSKANECLAEVNDGYLNQYKIDVTGMDKDTRTSLHHAIRASYDRLESSTVSEPIKNEADQNGKQDSNEEQATTDEADLTSEIKTSDDAANPKADSSSEPQLKERKFILITRRTKISRPKNTWPRDRPDHTHFILYKENKDTMDALHGLAAAVNTRPSNFSYAGIKDKRAVTCQWVSSWRLDPKRLVAAARRFNKRPFVKVGNFCFKKEPVRLGGLKGNRFDIVIRHLLHNKDGTKVIEDAMRSVTDKGFINYFGLQRFGTRSIMTHSVGLSILQAEWEKAVDMILSYRYDGNMQSSAITDQESDPSRLNDCDNSNISTDTYNPGRIKSEQTKKFPDGSESHNGFIDLWKSKLDAETVFKKYPQYRFTNEGIIMKALSKSEDASRDYMTALLSLPRCTRSLYVHSYQSYIWNKAATFRLKTYGFKVVPGDLILDPSISDNSLDILLSADDAGEPSNDQRSKTSSDNNNKESAGESNDHRKIPVEDMSAKITIATSENCHKYTIFDVVLPICGSRTRMPENVVADELNRLLKHDKLCCESFKTRERMFISYGSYRKIMVRPNNVAWRIEQYSHPHQNLVETDLERLNREIASRDKDSIEEPAAQPRSDSSDEALIVEFELPPSSYATMCVREIMKKPSTDFTGKF